MRAAAGFLVFVFVLAGCGGGSSETADSTTTSTAAATKGGCTQAEKKTHERSLSNEHLKLDAGKTYRLVFDTNCGSFTVTLNQKGAPNAAGPLRLPPQGGFFFVKVFLPARPPSLWPGGAPGGR